MDQLGAEPSSTFSFKSSIGKNQVSMSTASGQAALIHWSEVLDMALAKAASV